jgi:hypothetical protein
MRVTRIGVTIFLVEVPTSHRVFESAVSQRVQQRLTVVIACSLFLGLLGVIFVSNRQDETHSPTTPPTTSTLAVLTPEMQAAQYLEATCVGQSPVRATYVGPATDGHGNVGGWFFNLTTDTGYSYGVISVTRLPDGRFFTACR